MPRETGGNCRRNCGTLQTYRTGSRRIFLSFMPPSLFPPLLAAEFKNRRERNESGKQTRNNSMEKARKER